MGNIQGLFFTDIGTAWDRENPFRGTKNGRLEDLVSGYGFGVRLAFIFWIRYDLAWQYDLVNSSKPMQYWSLGYDF
jgi:hypothetical protein